MTVVWVFPGQGALRKGRGVELLDEFPGLCRRVEEVIGRPLRDVVLQPDGDPDRRLPEVQSALFALNAFAHLSHSLSAPPPDYLAGHSLGEYNALVAAGCVDFETGLRLVHRRAELLDSVPGGGMLAVVGLSQERMAAILAGRSSDDIDIANVNSRQQLVLSGPAESVRELAKELRGAGAAKCVLLDAKGAGHSRYMRPAAERFAELLRETAFSQPRTPIISNVTARPHRLAELPDLLSRHLYSPVLWSRSMDHLREEGVTRLVELGPGRVLTKLWEQEQEQERVHGEARKEPGVPQSGRVTGPRHAVLCSAASAEQLRAVAQRLRAHLDRTEPRTGSRLALADVAFTTQTGRTPLAHRLAVLCADLGELAVGLDAFLGGSGHPDVRTAVVPQPVPAGGDVPRTQEEAAGIWLDGGDVEWERLWPDGGSRVHLPTYPFPGGTAAPDEPSAVPGEPPAEAGDWLRDLFAEISGIPVDQVHPGVPLEQYGLSSALIVQLTRRLGEHYGTVPATLFFECRDLGSAAAELTRLNARTPEPLRPTVPVATGTSRAGAGQAMAVIGMAGRYPGAQDMTRFWGELEAGHEATGPIPAERARAHWPTDLMWGGYLPDVDCFDARLFRITPRDAARMDPQERVFLEVAWETLEDAGYTHRRLREVHPGGVGVYAGAMYSDYAFFGVEQGITGTRQDSGNSVGDVANRVSHFLDLTGPSLTVDTMCSSALAALHLAVRALRAGECEAALVGGVNLSLHPNKFVQMSRLNAFSSDHRCRSFAAGGDGIVVSEGVGAVLLKPLSRAVADGDRIHAVVRGTSLVHQGRTNGYLVPNPVAQGTLVSRALADADVEAAGIGYVETHGAGTELGDPLELEGLSRAFAAGGARRAVGSVPIGSVKSNIGHTEAAAGMAGLSKVILQLRHGRLVPSLHAEQLNPKIDWAGSPFRVQRTGADWPAPVDGAPRRAGVSAFGAGGTIAHAVVEEYREPLARPLGSSASAAGAGSLESAGAGFVESADAGPRLVLLSASDEDRLRALAGRIARATALRGTSDVRLSDVAHTLRTGREPQRERLALVVGDLAELRDELARFARGGASRGARGRAPVGDAGLAPRAGGDLEAHAEHWVRGGEIDWASVPGSGTGRLVELPHYPFARTRCWVPEAPVDAVASGPVAAVAEGAEGDGADGGELGGAAREPLLYEKRWRLDAVGPTASDITRPAPAGPVLCLCRAEGEPVVRALAEQAPGAEFIVVRVDESPTAVTEPSAVVDRALARCPLPVGLIDLVDLSDAAEPAGSGDSGDWWTRLAVIQAVLTAQRGGAAGSREGGATLLHLTTDRAAEVRMPGLVRAVAAEHRALSVATLCTDVPAHRAADLAAQLLEAWRAPGNHGELRYDDGLRHVPYLAEVPVPEAELTLDPDAVYVLTGATRGVGARVARHLVERGARQLLLLGARSLPPRSRWSDAVLPGPAAAAVATVRALEAAGATVLARRGELADRAGLAEALDDARSLGPLRGVVHCAGRLPERPGPLARRSAESVREVLAPKVDVARDLVELTEDDRLAFFLLFSSAAGTVPRVGAGVADYAAANAALDLLATRSAPPGPSTLRSVAWPMWRESGAAPGEANPGAVHGLDALDDAEALLVLEQVLALPGGHAYLPGRPVGATLDTEALLRVRDGGAQAEAESTEAAGGPAPAPRAAAPRAAAPDPRPTDEPPGWLVDLFAEVIGIPAAELGAELEFSELGVESVMLGELVLSIEERAGIRLDPGTLLDHPTLRRLAARLRELMPVEAASGEPEEAPAPGGAATAGATGEEERRPLPPVPAARSTAMAVIGMACRFPGAADLDAYWSLLREGRCAVTEVARSRWDTDALYSPDPAAGKITGKWGGFVEGIEEFDPEYFGLAEEEARLLDPAIRLSLECAAECLADAGYDPAELAGGAVGVYLGGRVTSYAQRAELSPRTLHSDPNFLAAQVAHHFDMRGPNLVVDSACSSSLAAVHLAGQALRLGDADLVLAGGVSVLLDDAPYREFSVARALSPSGRSHVFDERADGFVPGEGCGLLLLKPLAAAVRDGDRIHAVIEGSAMNNDGRTMGITTPNPQAQSAVVRRALSEAGRDPREMGLVEAHGTATMIGDPIELRALTDAFDDGGSPAPGNCLIGSVKSNMGHLMHAAGAAGLIKAVLAVRRGEIPPTLFCDRPNPRFDFGSSPLRPVTRLTPWPEGRPRLAGVSSFGFGGTNAHVVVGEAAPGAAAGAARLPRPAPAFRRRRLWLEREGRTAEIPAKDSQITAKSSVRTASTAAPDLSPPESTEQARNKFEPETEENGIIASVLELRFESA
ncbi:beta-ketoacyl synthase N-terminal-like domain-containing protein [Streptomyces sp. NPDC048441]|uniref:beta-ketoacyl synthase N-terminal-like domain-containing protein n=1 Tax=Streptomyces sp. NPDC048441 TaxID=3365552 RepID=UPI003712F81B